MKKSLQKKSNEKNITGYDDVLQYCNDVESGKIIACKQIKQQVAKFRRDMNEDCYIDVQQYQLVVSFFASLKHIAGKFAMSNFNLLPWQHFVIQNIVCLKKKKTNKNKYNEAAIFISRKNGKTAFMQGLQLFMLTFGEMGNEIFLQANNTREQQIIYQFCFSFCNQLDYKQKYYRHLRGKKISFDSTLSSLSVITGGSKFLDGSSPNLLILDEYHEQPNNNVYNSVKTGMQLRENPLLIIITTAGNDLSKPAYEYYQKCKKVLEGEHDIPSLFVLIFEQDNEQELKDERTWQKSNPSLHDVVPIDYLRELYTTACNFPSQYSSIMTKNFNVWVQGKSNPFIEEKYLQSAMSDDVQFSKKFVSYCGVDLASSNDLSQVSFVQKQQENKFVAKVMFYYPRYTSKKTDMIRQFDVWERQGFLTYTDTNVTDYRRITEDILQFVRQYPTESVSYDPWNATQWQLEMSEHGINMLQYSQSIQAFNRPTKFVEMLLLKEELKILNNQCLVWNFRNVCLLTGQNDNVKPVKANANSSQKIDGVISLIMQLQGYLMSFSHQLNNK